MQVERWAAFTDDPAGGNPAGVVLDATGADDIAMQRVAAEVGYSETAFLLPAGDGRFGVRYFSPLAEVPFCGHATIATGVAHAGRHGPGTMLLATRSGEVPVTTTVDAAGRTTATLTSVPPRSEPLAGDDVDRLLAALRWRRDELDDRLPLRAAYAGAWHPVVAAATAMRLADLDYDLAALGALMAGRGWTTVALVHRTGAATFDVRNPFPPGGVVEDPATGAAAAALGGYLRELGLVDPPATLTLRQGHHMGRPSVLSVHVPAGEGSGIEVSGTAVPIGGRVGA